MPETDEDNVTEAAEEKPAEEQGPEGPEVTVERTGPCECVIRIAATADYLRQRYQKDLAELQQEIALPGFRRGRAPIGLVESRMGTSLKSDLLASVVTEAYDEALDEHGLSVVAETEAPDLEEMSWEPGQPAEFEFRCEVLPDVTVEQGQYKGMKVEIPALEVTEELFNTEKERFAQRFATWEEVQGSSIDWDDYVEAKVSVPEAAWADTIGFFPRSERIGPLIVESLKGLLSSAAVGDKLEAETKVPEGKAGVPPELESVAGQTVKIQVEILRATRRKVPALDDDLARKIGLSSVEEIDNMVREQLDGALARRKEEVTRERVVRAVLEKVPFELPPSLLERAAEEERARTLIHMLRLGVPREEAERRVVQSAGLAHETAERSLKASLVLRKIAENERILVTEPEVEAQIRAFAARQGWREERARTYLERRGTLRSLRDDMREGKTVDFLLESAEVKEIPAEEFKRRYGGRESSQQ